MARPVIEVAMIVRNGAGGLARALGSVLPAVDRIVSRMAEGQPQKYVRAAVRPADQAPEPKGVGPVFAKTGKTGPTPFSVR